MRRARAAARGLFGWWRALPYFDPERYLFAYFFTGLVLFFFGGITGIINASVSMNNVVHNTSWIPAHFHTTIGGPVFLSFLGMTLFLVTQLTGKPLRLPRLNLVVPYLWTGGLFIFSFGLSVAGLLGEPRRTNLGLTYSNPDSPLFHPAWAAVVPAGCARRHAHGGGDAVFLHRVLRHALRQQGARAASCSCPRRRRITTKTWAWCATSRPWVVAAVVLLVVAYLPPLYEVITGPTQAVPGYQPGEPDRCRTVGLRPASSMGDPRGVAARLRRRSQVARRSEMKRTDALWRRLAGVVAGVGCRCRASHAQTLLPPDPSKTIGGTVSFAGFVDENGRDVGGARRRAGRTRRGTRVDREPDLHALSVHLFADHRGAARRRCRSRACSRPSIAS